MEQFNIFPPIPRLQPHTGQVLIAEPMLNDPNFARSVILLCEHGDEGSVGFVLNHATNFTLDALLPGNNFPSIDIYHGGPVEEDTLHILHRIPDIIQGGLEVTQGVFWGGSYEELKEVAWRYDQEHPNMRLFKGYSGWAPGQLEREINEGTWLVTDANDDLLFDTRTEDIWKKAIELLGKQYAYLANMPTDPQLN